jgi:hypothetical protein
MKEKNLVNNEEILKDLKASLMKNKFLKHLNIFNLSGSTGKFPKGGLFKKISKPCLGIFTSPWTNKTLESIQGNYTSSDLKDFVLMNTPVKEILKGEKISYQLNFISELKWNTHLVNIEDHVLVPLFLLYGEK